MPPTNERISALVRKEIAKNPNVGNDVLLEKASAIDRSVRRLSPRQFHATYRLPALRAARREASPAETHERPRARPVDVPSTTSRSDGRGAPVPAADASATQPGKAASASLLERTDMSGHGAATRPSPLSHATEREIVRQVLQSVAREALSSDDRTSFVRLLDSLDDRATKILSVFGRS